MRFLARLNDAYDSYFLEISRVAAIKVTLSFVVRKLFDLVFTF